MRLMPLVSASAFSLPIRVSGSTPSKLRSNMINDGLLLARSRTSFESLTNSSASPARLAASVSLTWKKRSLTTARIVFGSCFCIEIYELRERPMFQRLRGGDMRILAQRACAMRLSLPKRPHWFDLCCSTGRNVTGCYCCSQPHQGDDRQVSYVERADPI